jgi:hypothetical protein
VLSLAEVEVFEKGKNVALKKKATQATDGHGAVAGLALDGNVDGNYHGKSVTHTEPRGTDPWWEVDLGRMVDIDEIAVHNRTDSLGTRLDKFTLTVFDADRKVVFTKKNVRESATVSLLRPVMKSAATSKPKGKAKGKKPAKVAKGQNSQAIIAAVGVAGVGDGLIKKVEAGANTWVVDSESDWQSAVANQSDLELKNGLATPTAKTATFQSKLRTFDTKRSATSITIDQSPVWHNWQPIENLGPSNLGDAPVMLSLGPDNYWMFGRYGGGGKKGFEAEDATLEGFDIPLKTTPFPNQFKAPGGLKQGSGGYHAFQSKDMKNWVHHGPVTEGFSRWVTTAEFADGKLYIYYDYPNDQDPHVYVDENMTDGVPGKNMGMAFADPSHGSDCTFIRDLEGKFHVIYEDWSPINASKHSWDSPLAGHAVSTDGIKDFEIVKPAVDERTKPTGKFAEYPHPHWHGTLPDKLPAKEGEKRAYGKYEIHEPEQHAYGDWAAISVGGQYYLFADYHPAHDKIRVGWFTSSGLDTQFTFVGEIGRGHPDPDIMFAEGKFYLATQMRTDYVSDGPWVESVDVRVGVDTDKDGTVDKWTDWQAVKETYDYIKGFSKQVAKTPAQLDLSALPAGFGFQYEIKMTDTTENPSQPILDRVTLSFEE